MKKQNNIINILMYCFLFVCLYTSHTWSNLILAAMAEPIRLDKIHVFGEFTVYHLFTALFFVILFCVKLGPNNDRNILGNWNYLKSIFLIYFIVVDILLYLAIYLKNVTLIGLGIAPIVMFFVYLINTFYIQDVFLKNKDYKQLVRILTILEVMIFLRCCYSIIKYLLGFGFRDPNSVLGEGTRLAYESDFQDYFILLFIIALTNLLFDKNASKKIRILHYLSIITTSYVAIFSFRRYLWIEFLVASFIILFSHYRFNKIRVSKKAISVCFVIVLTICTIIFGGEKITHNYYVGRLLSSLSLINSQKYSSRYGTSTGHIDEISDGWYNVKRNWLLGISPFGTDLMKRFKTKMWQGGVYVHCAYLHVWLNYGLLGFILFIVLYWKSIRLGLELFNHKGLPYGLILFTFCCAQSTKNIIWPTVISHTNITLVYIFIISIAIRMKEIHCTYHTHSRTNKN